MNHDDTDEPPEWARERARELANATSDEAPNATSDEAPNVTSDEVPNAAKGDGSNDEADAERAPDVPPEAVDEAERLTRLAREATDADEAERYRERRDTIADDHEYVARVREEDDTLVLYPDEWVEAGTVQFDRIEDTDRAVEVSLSGPGDADRYREIAAYNDAVAEAVAEVAPEATAETHAATARSFAAFMSNHYVRPVDESTPGMREEFSEEFFPRNGWPTDEQRACLEESLELVERAAADLEEPTS